MSRNKKTTLLQGLRYYTQVTACALNLTHLSPDGHEIVCSWLENCVRGPTPLTRAIMQAIASSPPYPDGVGSIERIQTLGLEVGLPPAKSGANAHTSAVST